MARAASADGFSHAALAAAACLLCIVLGGCARERLVGRSAPAAPTWVVQAPHDGEASLHFHGTALGDNVLDEAAMRGRAMDDAREQIAERIASRVAVRTREVFRERGSRAAGRNDPVEAEYVRQVRTSAAATLHGVSLQETYWEKWLVDPGPFRRAFTRYKYHVLAAYPREEYRRRLDYYVRLASEPIEAQKLIREGRARQAADLLEALLDSYPEAPLTVRLTLADAYEAMQMYDRAARVLRGALRLDPDPQQEVRIRERIRELGERYPDLGNAAVLVTANWGGVLPRAEPARGWVVDALARANARLVGLRQPGSAGPDGAGKGEADWHIMLSLRELERDAKKNAYGIEVHTVVVQCTAEVTRTADGRAVAAVTESEQGFGRLRPMAVEPAAEAATRAALRRCFLAIAAEQPAQ